MSDETTDPGERHELRRRLTMAAQSAELIDLTSDSTGVPSVKDKAGKALPVRGIYLGTSGDLKVDMAGAGTVTFKNAPVGILPISVSKVYKTGSAAFTDALFLY